MHCAWSRRTRVKAEPEIAATTLELARNGLYVEPTAAQAAAGFRKLNDAGTIARRNRSVIVLTGSGLKAGSWIAELVEAGA